MALYTATQIAQVASQAGFKGGALVTATAIALAESGGNTMAYNPETAAGTPIGSGSRGLWQVYGKVHPQYNNDGTYDPLTNARAAYQISSSGTNFNPWSTYTNGAYKSYLQQANNVAGTGGTLATPTTTNYSALSTLQWVKRTVSHGYVPNKIASDWDSPHFAVDIAMPMNTPIGAAISGTVKQADYAVWSGKAGGGEVFITPDTGSAGGSQQWYVYHLNNISVKVGQHLNVGDLVGYSGGQNSGGTHNVDPMWSNGPHLHTGWFDGSYVQGRPHGTDFVPYLNQMKAGKFSTAGAIATSGELTSSTAGTFGFTLGYEQGGAFTTLSQQVHQTLTQNDGFYAIALAVDEAEQFPGYVNVATGPFDITGIIRSMGLSIADNTIPLVLRGGMMLLGTFILLMLIVKLADSSGALDVAKTALVGAAML